MFPKLSSPRSERIERFKLPAELEKKLLSTDRCFIVGMGPSLTKIDPKALENEVVFGVNFILRTCIKPDILCISDPTRVDDLIDASSPPIVTVRHLYDLKHEILDKGSSVYYDIDFIPIENATVSTLKRYPEEFDKVYCGGTVIGDLCLPLAAYLGFSKIFIVGLDGFAATFPQSHAWGNDPAAANLGQRWIRGTESLNRKAYELCAFEGVSVKNATPGSTVHAFPRARANDLDIDIFKRDFAPGTSFDKYIVFKGHVLQISASEIGPGAFKFTSVDNKKVLRHRDGHVYLDTNSNSEQFKKDSSFWIEPSFINKEWFSLRSYNITDSYVTSQDERSEFFLTVPEKTFSAYFSSFRPYETIERARKRVSINNLITNIDEMQKNIGSVMLNEDSQA